jgi:NTP pyrophosphatase (non-canonical NTP hydrolase)
MPYPRRLRWDDDTLMNLQKIQKLSLEEKKSLLERTIKLQEEVGELAQQVLIQTGSSGSHHKKAQTSGIQEEAVDVTLVALSIFFLEGGTPLELEKIVEAKMGKWEASQLLNSPPQKNR